MPPEVLARITSLTGVGAFALGPVGLAAAGPLAAVTGVTTVLAFGAVWQLVAGAVVLAVPDVRRLTTPARAAGPPAAAPVE
ncbi:hypothetical protein Ssi03_12200 [Sphaerisporangium siamense]|uniref:MFS transporter n=1 Tax=Sphaerisporangium siamense TaxID=795645 RepID=A0A7W7DAJ6_9ACTN|nr:hypothetical protein [Sphaerisporangium siamense]MBB4703009.1 hypothetical protein [Sphaerisporangium siamense]GII83230.1 hypothetical protein Ssi03_12200 [Sphaerisporangium siamense]